MNTATIVYLILFLIIGIAGTFWFILEKKYKHRAREKTLIKGRKIVRDFRACEFLDKQGVRWWKLAGSMPKDHKKIPVPPEEAIELNNKGKMVIEFYRMPGGEILFSKEAGDISGFPEETIAENRWPKTIKELEDGSDEKAAAIKEWEDNKKAEWIKDNNIVSAKHPITTNQRLVYLMNLKEAESRRNKKDTFTAMIQLGSLGIIAMVVVSLMIFWGDIAAPATAANGVAAQQATTLKETAQILKDLKQNIQTIDSKLDSMEQGQPSTAPD